MNIPKPVQMFEVNKTTKLLNRIPLTFLKTQAWSSVTLIDYL